jgi:hypothetical protein
VYSAASTYPQGESRSNELKAMGICAGKDIDPMEQRIISALTTGPEPASAAAPAARHSRVGAR